MKIWLTALFVFGKHSYCHHCYRNRKKIVIPHTDPPTLAGECLYFMGSWMIFGTNEGGGLNILACKLEGKDYLVCTKAGCNFILSH